MKKVKQNVYLRHFISVVCALLISNIAALSCALAVTVGSDCPIPEPTHCVEMCDIAEAISIEKAPEGTSDPRTPVLGTYEVLADLFNLGTNLAIVEERANRLDTHSPPINLLNCVFLK
jgi:hypothetical protein